MICRESLKMTVGWQYAIFTPHFRSQSQENTWTREKVGRMVMIRFQIAVYHISSRCVSSYLISSHTISYRINYASVYIPENYLSFFCIVFVEQTQRLTWSSLITVLMHLMHAMYCIKLCTLTCFCFHPWYPFIFIVFDDRLYFTTSLLSGRYLFFS